MKATEEFDYDCVADHAEQLRELAGVIQEGTRKLTQVGIVIGEAFLTAKDKLDHGTFTKWCEAETPYSPRMAELYMNRASLFRRREDGKDLLLLSLSSALELARPSVDEADVTEILARARRGERLTVEFVKNFVRAKKDDGEPAAVCALNIARIVAEALNPQERSLVMDFLGAKSGSRDLPFVKSLRAALVEKCRREEVRTKPLMLSELPAA